MFKRFLATAALLAGLLPGAAWACACGCGVFDVGTGTMMPTGEGGTVWFEYDFMNQTQNWSNFSRASKDQNGDKLLRSDFFQVGAQYMFNRSWGVEAVVPWTHRFFKTTDDDTGDLVKSAHTALGDVHLQAVYSGFSDDMSTGITFGFKIPTGDYHFSGFDRDTAIGTGSLDLLLGGYHMGELSEDYGLNWFTNVQWDHAFVTQSGYRPGDEVDASLGSYYNFGPIGGVGNFSPLLQFVGSQRWRDSGPNADPPNSGYTRLNISPGAEYDIGSFKLYGDLEFPIYQYVNGDQITTPFYLKFIVAYSF